METTSITLDALKGIRLPVIPVDWVDNQRVVLERTSSSITKARSMSVSVRSASRKLQAKLSLTEEPMLVESEEVEERDDRGRIKKVTRFHPTSIARTLIHAWLLAQGLSEEGVQDSLDTLQAGDGFIRFRYEECW